MEKEEREAFIDEMAAMAALIIRLAEYGQDLVDVIEEHSELVEELGDDLVIWRKEFQDTLNNYRPDMDDGRDDPRYF